MENPDKKRPAKEADKYIVRLPDGMREKIAEAAKANNRSMNAEIVDRLQTSFSQERMPVPPGADSEKFIEALATRLAEKLKNS